MGIDPERLDGITRALGRPGSRREALAAALAAAAAAPVAGALAKDGDGNKGKSKGKDKAKRGSGGEGRQACSGRGMKCGAGRPACCAGLSCQGNTCGVQPLPAPSGPTGPQGPQGPKGPTSRVTGPTGLRGPQGAYGPDGADTYGPTGPAGPCLEKNTTGVDDHGSVSAGFPDLFPSGFYGVTGATAAATIACPSGTTVVNCGWDTDVYDSYNGVQVAGFQVYSMTLQPATNDCAFLVYNGNGLDEYGAGPDYFPNALNADCMIACGSTQ